MSTTPFLVCLLQGRQLIFVLVAGPLLTQSIPYPEDFPNLLAGTFTDGQSFSTGNTLPLVTRPWGFNNWCPQTTDGATSWWFKGNDPHFHWLRLTHQPSPWIGDWAWMMFGPQMGGFVEEPTMFFEPWAARIKPYVFDATLGPDNMRVQLTPTDHCAVLKVSFPAHNPNNIDKRVCFKLPPPDKGKSPGDFKGYNSDEYWTELTIRRAADVPYDFGLHVRAEVDVHSLKHASDIGRRQKHLRQGALHCFEFSPTETDVTIYIGSSLISLEQAKVNMKREVLARTFEQVEKESRLVWRTMLSRIDVVDPGEITAENLQRLTSFYTGLYRALTFPRRLDEVDANGKRVHYSPYHPQGGVHDGVLVTDNGFWDTYRTVYPLLSLAYPQEAGEIVTGWVNAYREGGWLPEWSSPGYRQCMVGTFASVVVADAVLKELPGVNHDFAWEAMAKDSFQAGGGKRQGGKANYNEYNQFGYMPLEKNGDSVSATLDYAFSDYAVSLAAEKLSKPQEAEQLRNRAQNAQRHMFDASAGLMRPKSQSGGFRTSDPSKWGGGYIEGSAWHHSFPPFDLKGLIELHGSKSKLANKIREMIQSPGSFLFGTYGRPIHEMEEMRAFGMGQFAFNNQVVHHILFLLLALDEGSPECATEPPSDTFCPRRFGESTIDKVLRRGFTFDFLSGDEDNGEMGSWYILTALGLFEPAPGTKLGYVLGSPMFRKVNVYRQPRSGNLLKKASTVADSPPSFSIESSQAGTENGIHINKVLLNGESVGHPGSSSSPGWTLSYEKLLEKPGSVLRFVAEGEPIQLDGNKPAPAVDMVRPSEVISQSVEPTPARVEAPPSAILPSAIVSPVLTPIPQVIPQGNAGSQNMQNMQSNVPAMQKDERSHELDDALHQLQDQRVKMEHLEGLLRTQNLKTKADSEMDFALHSSAQIAFFILVAVNLLGWVACVMSRRGKTIAQTPKNSKGKKSRRAAEGTDV